jgi:hypothetical protein
MPSRLEELRAKYPIRVGIPNAPLDPSPYTCTCGFEYRYSVDEPEEGDSHYVWDPRPQYEQNRDNYGSIDGIEEIGSYPPYNAGTAEQIQRLTRPAVTGTPTLTYTISTQVLAQWERELLNGV